MVIYTAQPQPEDEAKSHRLDNYRFYQAAQLATPLGSAVHTFHFETLRKQHFRVDYPSSLYKLVYCFEGYAENFCGGTKIRSFQKGKALFYRTHPDTYSSQLKSDTRFQIVHLHLSQPMVDQLETLLSQPLREVEIEIPIPPSSYELLNINRILDCCRPDLVDLYVEKTVFDQLYYFFGYLRSHICTILPVHFDAQTANANLLKNITISYEFMGDSSGYRIAPLRQWEVLQKLVDLIREKCLEPYISRVYDFEEIPLSHQAMEQGHTTGKMIVAVKA